MNVFVLVFVFVSQPSLSWECRHREMLVPPGTQATVGREAPGRLHTAASALRTVREVIHTYAAGWPLLKLSELWLQARNLI